MTDDVETQTATLFVIDEQNADGTWRGVASMWSEVNPLILDALLAVFKDNDQTGTYRLVRKDRTETTEETVLG
jgi:hypothetical protein